MLLNGFALNRAALNGAALLAILYGGVSGTAGATGSPVATKTQYAHVAANSGVVVTLEAYEKDYGFTVGSAGAVSLVTSTQSHSAKSALSAGATGIAFVYNARFAYAGGDCSATGYALPNSKLADVAASSGVSGSFISTLNQHAKSSVSGTAAGTAEGVKTQHPAVTTAPGCAGYADWQYKASGGSTWLHDGHAWASAGGILAVDETKYKVVIGDGLIATAEASVVARAYVECRARSSTSCNATATSEAIRTAYATMAGTVGCANVSVATYNHMASVAGACGVLYTQQPNFVTVAGTGSAEGIGIASAQINGMIVKFAGSAVPCGATGLAAPYVLKFGAFSVSASVSVTANAFGNAGVHATTDRTMTVPAENRGMAVPFDDRIMRLTA